MANAGDKQSRRPPKPTKPRWRRRPETRPDEIAQAGLRLFCARGYSDVSVDDIAGEAGVTKGAVYHHFGGKEDLLVAALELHFRRAYQNAGVDKPPAGVKTAKGRVEALLWAGWQLWHSDEFQGLFRLILGEGGAAVPIVRERFLTEGPHRGWKVLGALIDEGQKAGEFRREVDAGRAARLIASGLVLQIMLASLSGGKNRGTRDAFDREFKTVLQMLIA